jgi:hypothetical protein
LRCGISELSSLSESERRIWQDDEMFLSIYLLLFLFICLNCKWVLPGGSDTTIRRNKSTALM